MASSKPREPLRRPRTVSVAVDAVRHELPELTSAAVDLIRTEVPAYAVVDHADHVARVMAQLTGLLDGLEVHRPPAAGELAAARDLGAQRAGQGIAMTAVTSAYHVGYRELWRRLALHARADGGADVLVDVVDLVWSWVEAVSSAAAQGHAAATRAHDAQRLDLGHQLVQLVLGGGTDDPQTALLARTIGFEPSETFHAACIADTGPDELEHLRRAVPTGGTIHVEPQGPVVLVVSQHVELPAWLDRTLHDAAAVGIGLPRRGLAGLRQSVADAQDALALARRSGEVVDFARSWPQIVALQHRDQLAPLLASAHAVATDRMALAVLAYAHGGFSIVRAGEALHLHPNTVTYRLDRWHRLTGWDPRSRDGLITSLAALALGPWDDPPLAS